MKVLDLFSGIGGFSLGLHRAGMGTVAFCEIEKFPQQVLRKNFPGVPIYDDIRTLTADRLRADGIAMPDLICGGFPCQPFSVAGQRKGKEDNRHLWPEMYRLIKECKPTWVIGENVAGFIDMALSEVLTDLEAAGYEVQPFVIPACAVNAPHRRDRVWIVAHSYGNSKSRCAIDEQRKSQGAMVSPDSRLLRPPQCQEQTAGVEQCSQKHDVPLASSIRRNTRGDIRQERHLQDDEWTATESNTERSGWFSGVGEISTDDADTNIERMERSKDTRSVSQCGEDSPQLTMRHSGKYPDWSTESPFCGVAHGIPRRVDRLKGLGNAVLPQIPEIIGRAIMEVSAT